MKIQHSINQKRADQFFLGLPISIVRGMKWKKGDEIVVEIMGKDKLKLERKKPGTVE